MGSGRFGTRRFGNKMAEDVPGTAAEDAEELKMAKYVCLTDKGCIFNG